MSEDTLLQHKKSSEIKEMFNGISSHYDLLNHLLSFNRDVAWRKRVVKEVCKLQPEIVLDVATGTADLAIMAAKKGVKRVIGVDFSEEMIAIGNQKVVKENLTNTISLLQADALSLPMENESFDVVTIAFGIRNFENLSQGLSEVYRVLKKEGTVFILEFGQPVNSLVKFLYTTYNKLVMPLVSSLVGSDKRAYNYLRESSASFPSGNALLPIIEAAGFNHCSYRKHHNGVVYRYAAKK